jgi:hypothetical protein
MDYFQFSDTAVSVFVHPGKLSGCVIESGAQEVIRFVGLLAPSISGKTKQNKTKRKKSKWVPHLH